jgi:hypothetical protein
MMPERDKTKYTPTRLCGNSGIVAREAASFRTTLDRKKHLNLFATGVHFVKTFLTVLFGKL